MYGGRGRGRWGVRGRVRFRGRGRVTNAKKSVVLLQIFAKKWIKKKTIKITNSN